MENLLGSLRRENKERERRLNVADKKLLSDMVGYMKTQKICDYDVEQVRKTIIRNTLRAYGKRKNLEILSGGDYREYCNKLCENMRHAFRQRTHFVQRSDDYICTGADVSGAFRGCIDCRR